MVHLSCRLLWRRLWVCSIFYPFLGLLGIWTIPGDVPFVFSIEEIILPSLPLVLVSILIPALANSLAFGLFLRRAVWACLRWLIPLLVVSSLFYVEDLLVLRLLWLRLTLASIAL